MSFVQIIDMRATNVDDIQNLERQSEQATEGKRTLRRSIIGRDRNDPDHYLVLAFFDSYESAMVNSNLPQTNEFGQKQSTRQVENGSAGSWFGADVESSRGRAAGTTHTTESEITTSGLCAARWNATRRARVLVRPPVRCLPTTAR